MGVYRHLRENEGEGKGTKVLYSGRKDIITDKGVSHKLDEALSSEFTSLKGPKYEPETKIVLQPTS